jgi:adenylosuccinate lyase
MFIYPERMKANLERTGGLVFSGQLLLELVEQGVSREDAYRLVQGHAMRAWNQGLNFREQVLNDRNITGRVPEKAIQRAFDLKRQLRHIDAIFARVFAPRGTRAASRPKSSKRNPPAEADLPGRIHRISLGDLCPLGLA